MVHHNPFSRRMIMILKNILPFTTRNEDPTFDRIPYTIYNQAALRKHAKVTVIVPVYNAEKYVKKTIDSVIVQTIGFSHITLILVDDGSTDKSRHILRKYTKLYPNIVAVLLDENTGTPAYPRNLGIHLSNSTYVTFLDGDDWLDHDGIRQLHSVMEEAGTDYAVGKTIQVDGKKEKLIGRYESCKVRKNVSPYEIPHIFYHLGPTARMMRSSFIRKHQFRFPEMKYAEDKRFFIDILTHVGEISTTTAPVYYINRYAENQSLTKQTDIIEKMDTNITVLKYVLDKGLPPEQEKMIVNRLVEFDSITRLFNRKHFVNSENQQAYFSKFEEVISIFSSYNRPYTLEETIKKPLNKEYFSLLVNREYDRVVALAEWATTNGDSSQEKRDGMPYNVARLSDGTTIPIEVPVQAEVVEERKSGKDVIMEVELTGHRIPDIQAVELQNREFIEDLFIVADAVEQTGHLVTLTFTKETFAFLEKGKYILSLRYDDYESVMVAKESERKYELEGKGLAPVLYQTNKGNLSLKVM